jgi:predicted DNA-binding transcriptional regulator YafY
MRLHRLIAILLLLESRGSIKARELADALETSERTIYRDIDILCEAGVPIAALAGPSGGFSLMEGYSVNMKQLHCDDIVNLFLSGIGIRPDEHSEASLNLKKTILKLEKSLPSQYIPDIKTARQRFHFDPGAWWQERPPVYHMDTLRHAVWKSKKLVIEYRKLSRSRDEVSTRHVRPYGLVVKNMDWYLAAYCEERDEMRVFKCDRILRAEILEEGFTVPEEFNLEEFWKQQVGDFKSSV